MLMSEEAEVALAMAVKMQIEERNKQKRSGNTALGLALENENTGHFIKLLEANADVNIKQEDDYTPLMIAISFIEERKCEIVNIILQNDYDVILLHKALSPF